jgi:hypothetical protein
MTAEATPRRSRRIGSDNPSAEANGPVSQHPVGSRFKAADFHAVTGGEARNRPTSFFEAFFESLDDALVGRRVSAAAHGVQCLKRKFAGLAVLLFHIGFLVQDDETISSRTGG